MAGKGLLTKRTASKVEALKTQMLEAFADGYVSVEERRALLAGVHDAADDANDTHYRQQAARLLMHDVEDVRHTDAVLARAGVSLGMAAA